MDADSDRRHHPFIIFAHSASIDNPDKRVRAAGMRLSFVIPLDRPEEADAVLNAALARHPDDFDTQVLYLRVLVTNKSEKAPQLGQNLLLIVHHNWEILYLNAQLEMREGQFSQAHSHLEQSVALKSDYFQSQEALGSVLFKLKDFSGAKEHLEKAVELGDSEPAVQYELANVLGKLGQVDRSKEKLLIFQTTRKAEADRTLVAGKIESGDRALAAGDAAQAGALYREALVNAPNEALVAYKLAKALALNSKNVRTLGACSFLSL